MFESIKYARCVKVSFMVFQHRARGLLVDNRRWVGGVIACAKDVWGWASLKEQLGEKALSSYIESRNDRVMGRSS